MSRPVYQRLFRAWPLASRSFTCVFRSSTSNTLQFHSCLFRFRPRSVNKRNRNRQIENSIQIQICLFSICKYTKNKYNIIRSKLHFISTLRIIIIYLNIFNLRINLNTVIKNVFYIHTSNNNNLFECF